MPIQESGEMYLETILILSQQGGSVRSLDVANYMGYSKPSISRAMGILKNEEYITIDENGFIKLTPSGSKIAKKIYERHVIICDLLKNIGVDKKTAEEDACRIEHVISDKTFKAIKKFNKSLTEE